MTKLKTLLAACSVSAVAAMPVAAQGFLDNFRRGDGAEPGVLQHMADNIDLAIYRTTATKAYCDHLDDEVFPSLNNLDLRAEFSTAFQPAQARSQAYCQINYGAEEIFTLYATDLDMGDTFEHEDIAEVLLEAMDLRDLETMRSSLNAMGLD
jgi:hypothetical protein